MPNTISRFRRTVDGRYVVQYIYFAGSHAVSLRSYNTDTISFIATKTDDVNAKECEC